MYKEQKRGCEKRSQINFCFSQPYYSLFFLFRYIFHAEADTAHLIFAKAYNFHHVTK